MDFAASRRRRVALSVAAVAVLALAARFAFLGHRVFHWDEARVGYWILRYRATGEWHYRAIVHGPFLFHVNKYVFGVFGPTDAAARYVVALAGGLLPVSALLFRTRLRDAEVVALAALLALNPVLLYYSRFMRNDVLVGAFALTALGFAVRAMDTGRRWNLVAAGAFMGLAFTTKENALVYVAMFVGATALLLDSRLLTARVRDETWAAVVRDYLRWAARGVWAWRRSLAGAVAAFFAIVVFFYAPRPDFYEMFGSPGRIPGVLEAATLGAWREFWSTWGVSGVGRDHSYVAFLKDALETLWNASLMLLAAGVLGFFAERYVASDARDVVMFAGYWAGASIIVYPAITDISGHWSVVHAVVPMAIPAAVGIRLVVDKGRSALAADDAVGVGLALLVLVAAFTQMGVVALETSYLMPQDEDNVLVQFGQPGSEALRDEIETIESVAREYDGDTDVLFYGSHFHVRNAENPTSLAEVSGTNWYHRLPLAWYLQRSGARTDSTLRLPAVKGTDAPVVITRAKHYGAVAPALYERGYVSRTYELTASNTHIVVFVNPDAPGYARP